MVSNGVVEKFNTSFISQKPDERYQNINLNADNYSSALTPLLIPEPSKTVFNQKFNDNNQQYLSSFSKNGINKMKASLKPSDYLDVHIYFAKTVSTNTGGHNSSTLSCQIPDLENFVKDNEEKINSNYSSKFKTGIDLNFSCPYEFPRQQTDKPVTPEIARYKASQRLIDPNNAFASSPSISPIFRKPNIKTIKQFHTRIGAAVKHKTDEFKSSDPQKQLNMFQQLVKENLRIQEELRQVKHHLDLATREIRNSYQHKEAAPDEDVEMVELPQTNEASVQTTESRIKEDEPCKEFKAILERWDIQIF